MMKKLISFFCAAVLLTGCVSNQSVATPNAAAGSQSIGQTEQEITTDAIASEPTESVTEEESISAAESVTVYPDPSASTDPQEAGSVDPIEPDPAAVNQVASVSNESSFALQAPQSGSYTFTAVTPDSFDAASVGYDGDSVTWDIYVLDEEFNEAYRYLGQAYDAALSGDGTIYVEEGQYIYGWCSYNEFTGENMDCDFTTLTVTLDEEPPLTSAVPDEESTPAPAVLDGFTVSGETASFEATTSGTYMFIATQTTAVDFITWDIYVLDDAYEDAPRYLAQERDPDLSGDGALTIAKGQFVYCLCSYNEFTAEDTFDESLCTMEVTVS